MTSNSHLKWCLDTIRKTFDVSKIIGEIQQEQQIKKYYLANHWSYQLLHNREGYIHMGISKHGIYRKSDLLAQATTVNEYIKKINARSILELAPGNGANSAYLAIQNPEVQFTGLDLSKKPFGRFKKIKNYIQLNGNFHDLNRFPDTSFDIIFIIEALCHSSDVKQVFNEVFKKLKNNGLFIIFDGYRNKKVNEYSKDELLAMQLVEKTMSVNEFTYIKTFKEIIKNSQFEIIRKADLSPNIMPSLKRSEKEALLFYRYRLLKNIMKILIPEIILKNSIAGLLMPEVINQRLACYYLHVLKKK